MRLKGSLKKLLAQLLVVDVLMMCILVANLGLILFEMMFSIKSFELLIAQHLNGFHQFYNQWVHKNFLTIDMGFVSIYLAEFSARWLIAITRQTYHRWFFYPFIHWYDVIGCIPLGTFRALRLLRVVAIVYRLHRLGVIDIDKTYIYSVFLKYRGMLVEELSDRVLISGVENVQRELRSGNPLMERIVTEVVLPQKEALLDELSIKCEHLITTTVEKHGRDFRTYSDEMIAQAFEESRQVSSVEAIPVLGEKIVLLIQSVVQSILRRIIDNAGKDLKTIEIRQLIADLEKTLFEGEPNENQRTEAIITQVMIESLDLVKDQLAVKQWKLKELEDQTTSN